MDSLPMIDNITILSGSIDKDHGLEDEPQNQGSIVPTLRTRLLCRRGVMVGNKIFGKFIIGKIKKIKDG